MKQQMKPGWKMVKFGDVVKNANLVERDFDKAGIERIVGLEHLDPENLHIRRWNIPENGTSFSRKFVPGQTLFGKRRAYQRKVAYAEFEGICSGDILTFESKDPKMLLPALLPFICQSDTFFNHALGTSAGSLSPRTSWNALKYFEFPLPPIEEQKRIAEILWAADEAVEAWKRVLGSISDMISATLRRAFDREPNAKIGDVVKLASGKVKTKKQQFDFSKENQIPVFGGNGITGYTNKRLLSGPVIIIGRVGEYCGSIHKSNKDCWVTDNAIYIKYPSREIELDYLYYALSHANLNSKKLIAGQPLINQAIISSTPFYLPSIEQQRIIIEKVSGIQVREKIVREHISSTTELQKKILNGFVVGENTHV